MKMGMKFDYFHYFFGLGKGVGLVEFFVVTA